MQKIYVKDKNFYKMVAGIAIPIAMQGLITTGVNMMDTIMVGALGETALSAVSLANQFINIYHIFCMGIGMGASVLVARYFGMGDQMSLKKTVAIMLRLCLSLAALFCIATIIMPAQIMKIYTVETDIITCGVRYLKYSVASYFLLGLSLTSTIILRNVGQVKLPLYTSIITFFINVGANYALIFGKLGMPRMDVAGAALGTLIARLTEFMVTFGYIFFLDKLCFVYFLFVSYYLGPSVVSPFYGDLFELVLYDSHEQMFVFKKALVVGYPLLQFCIFGFDLFSFQTLKSSKLHFQYCLGLFV